MAEHKEHYYKRADCLKVMMETALREATLLRDRVLEASGDWEAGIAALHAVAEYAAGQRMAGERRAMAIERARMEEALKAKPTIRWTPPSTFYPMRPFIQDERYVGGRVRVDHDPEREEPSEEPYEGDGPDKVAKALGSLEPEDVGLEAETGMAGDPVVEPHILDDGDDPYEDTYCRECTGTGHKPGHGGALLCPSCLGNTEPRAKCPQCGETSISFLMGGASCYSCKWHESVDPASSTVAGMP